MPHALEAGNEGAVVRFLDVPLSLFYISLYNCVLPCFAYCALMFSAFFQQLGGTTATLWILRA
jgi:hypothetical protein